MKKILVVDDDRVLRQLLKDILDPAGYEVLEADDGKQALACLDAQKIDLIITDRAMPGMGGLELLQELAKRKSRVPSVMMSAFGEESLWGQAIGLGAQDYILKPFAANDVLKIVKKCLAGGKGK